MECFSVDGADIWCDGSKRGEVGVSVLPGRSSNLPQITKGRNYDIDRQQTTVRGAESARNN